MEETIRADGRELDLRQVFYILRRRIWIIILAVVLGAGAAGAYSMMLVEPVYSSTSMIYLVNVTTDISALTNLQVGSQLTSDYIILLKSRPVMEQVIEELHLSMTSEGLSQALSITNPADTHILTITASHHDAYIAREIADAVARIGSVVMAEVMETDEPRIVETAQEAIAPSSPNIQRNCAIGGLIAGGIVIFIFIMVFLWNDTIRSAEDIERYLGVTTLGLIPDSDEAKGNGKKKRRHRKKKRRELKRAEEASRR